MTTDIRERAWFGVHDRLPAGWRVCPAFRHPHTGRWSVSAVSPRHAGRGVPQASVEGHGEDEIAALTDLSIKLDELRAVERRMVREERARAAYLPERRTTRGGRWDGR